MAELFGVEKYWKRLSKHANIKVQADLQTIYHGKDTEKMMGDWRMRTDTFPGLCHRGQSCYQAPH